MNLFSMIAAFGVWPALPLTGNLLFARHYRTLGTNPFPLVTSFSLTTVAGIAIWSVPMLLAGMVGVYRAESFGLLGWVITLSQVIWLLKKRKPALSISLKSSVWDWVLAVGMILAAVLYLCFSTESILGGIDQGVYANHAIYIANHGRLDVPYPWNESHNSVFSNIFEGFPGFFKTKPTMTVQFAHLFPVWLAQAFSTFGHYGLFRANGIFALLSLGTFYGLCRAVFPKPFAVVATLFLAFNPSQLWLARTTLTEILAQLLIWSSILLLLQSLHSNSKVLAQWAGIFLGLSTLTRIDSLLLIPLFLISYLVVKFLKDPLLKKTIWFAFSQLVILFFSLAIFYYAFFSTPYFQYTYSLFVKSSMLTAFAVLLILVTPKKIIDSVRPYLTSKIFITLIVITIILLTTYAYWIRPIVEPYAVFNLPFKYPLNGLRDYREDSLINLARYLSPFVVWSAIFGWLMALWAVSQQKQNGLIVLVTVIGGFSGLYLWNPYISPNHFFAIRRFVPVIIPGFIFFASLGIWWIVKKFSKTWFVVASISIFVLISTFILEANATIVTFAENHGYFIQLQQLSEKLPENKLILANGSTTWLTPLYIAFDRKVIPINLSNSKNITALNSWVLEQLNQQKPVYLLNEDQLGRFRTIGWQSSKLDEIVLSRSFIESTVKPLPKKILAEQKIISLYKITGLSNTDYLNVVLGAEWAWDIQESGFIGQEWHGSKPFRWTNGTAKLVVPLNEQRLPQALQIDLESTGSRGTKLSVVVNGKELFNNQLASGSWSATLSLADVELGKTATIELLSDTWVPKEMIEGSEDSRTLGVAVLGVKLLEK